MKATILFILITLAISTFGQTTIIAKINDSFDDATQDGLAMVLLESSLNIGRKNGNSQSLGLRFQNIAIPKEAEILTAYVQFTASEDYDESLDVIIMGEHIGDSPAFTLHPEDLTKRIYGDSIVSWEVDGPWYQDFRGADQKTPNLRKTIQEIIDHPDWVSGNALSLFMTAEVGYDNFLSVSSYDSDLVADFPELTITFSTASDIQETGNETSLLVHPNPVADVFSLDLDVKKAGQCTISVFDVTGKKIDVLLDEELKQGNHNYTFSVNELGLRAGIYLLHCQSPESETSSRIVVQ